MKIAVIGAGIIGITTAYELAADGHEVTVLERRSAAAEETSFANAGVIAPGYVTPWAAPGMPGKVLASLWHQHSPVRVSLPLSGRELAWMWSWWRACQLEHYTANRQRMQRLAFYSRQRLHQLTRDLALDYDRSDGYTVLLRSDKDLQLVQPSLQVLRDAGVPFDTLDATQARAIEPALNPDTTLFGAIHLPDDEVGNCRQFALLLKTQAQNQGVFFRFNTSVSALSVGNGVSITIANNGAKNGVKPVEYLYFDAAVVCAGTDSAPLLRPLGLPLPLAAVHGYSISAAMREPMDAPRSAVMDERYKVAITRLGNRVRVAGSAQLGGKPSTHDPRAVLTLYKVLQDWFPGAAQLNNVQTWKGARPMTPDGPPILGASGIPHVWLNLGHGASGWALSCGSARAVADLIAKRKPDVDLEGLGVGRLGVSR